jgi:circadian clock protein KaiC
LKPNTSARVPATAKSLTGIKGLDEITSGGLPRRSATLLEGGSGSGKTVLALQSLVNGARLYNEPGIFVAFEESSARIIANAAEFGWDLPALQRKKLFFLDAQLKPDLIQSGNFDLVGLLAALTAKADEIKAKRIVFDAVDVVLTLLNDPIAERFEAFRLHQWLVERPFSAIITAKTSTTDSNPPFHQPLSFLQFMVDCSVTLNHNVVQGVSQRNLRVVKYRGSAFEENESPFVIGSSGLEVASTRMLDRSAIAVSTKRVSSGVERLDAMLGGGYYLGSSILFTGAPGTAKTTLCCAFAEAACRRGDRTLLVSFDSDSGELTRNLASVRIRLDRFVKNGKLCLFSARSTTASAETHLMRILNLAREHGARCVVIDPISVLSKTGNRLTAHSVAERLLDWARANAVTLACTSLLTDASPQMEGSPMEISTIADTWIHLNYQVQGGERNRGLSIIKSRGTAHSNQVRELVLSSAGVTLADAYTASGEVLMGTARWEKEQSENTERAEAVISRKQKRISLEAQELELQARLKSLQLEVQAKQAERKLLSSVSAIRDKAFSVGRKRLGELRRADATPSKAR